MDGDAKEEVKKEGEGEGEGGKEGKEGKEVKEGGKQQEEDIIETCRFDEIIDEIDKLAGNKKLSPQDKRGLLDFIIKQIYPTPRTDPKNLIYPKVDVLDLLKRVKIS